VKKILVFILLVITLLSLAACKKEPIIGYEPKIPPEWAEEEEREKNEKYAEAIRTLAFDGVWKNVSSGKSFYVFNGFIFDSEILEDGTKSYFEWGTIVALQMVEKEKVDEINGAGRESLESGEKIQLILNSGYTNITNAEITVVSDEKIKVTASDGTEEVYQFVDEVDGWPKGYRD